MSQSFQHLPAEDVASLRNKVLADAAGHILARALHVASELQLAEQFGDGTMASTDLAARTGSDGTAMHRLLDYLAAHGYFEALPGGGFRLTPLGTMLRRDAPDKAAAVIASLGHPGVWAAFGNLGEVVRTGLPPEQGRGRALYAQPANSAADQLLADSMIGYHAGEPALVAERFDFSASSRVVDVGGSSGRLLTAILAAHPHLSGVVFDRAGTEPEACALIADAGLSDRCTFTAGSFFDVVPEGADTYILSHILHDWSDREAADILASCRRAMGPGSRLLIIEAIRSSPGEGAGTLPADMLLLATTQGRLRTLEEMMVLLERSGFALAGETPVATATIIEVLPAGGVKPKGGLLSRLAGGKAP
jgi:SAM-dependent methyltransferase